LSDIRVDKFARLLVNYSARIKEGDRVAIEATTSAEPLVRALYAHVLEAGGHPNLILSFPDQEEIFFDLARDHQLDTTPDFLKYSYENFESRIRVHSSMNPRGLSGVDPQKLARFQKAFAPITQTQMARGADGHTFRWVTTLYPTPGYAVEAGMSTQAYEDFVYRACHANESDPVAYWQSVQQKQQRVVDWLKGKNQVTLQGPNVDLSLSIKGRTFMNSCGTHNMPDGEVYTGPVEESVNGWVKFTYPAIYNGTAVEGIELIFSNGKVTTAKADKNQDFLLAMLESDAGARYLGEFAIGTNFEIDRFTGNILFDEKIGGTFHMALGAGYPETGSKNRSVIHWDMICDMRKDSTISVDGETLYENGKFVIE
jgi:aminopeptidase